MSKFEQSQRILNVQTPVIPVVGTLIRENPGTISLGQGVVYYGPPQEALDAYVDFIADPEMNKYQLVQGTPQLLAAITAKLETDNDIRIDSRRQVVVTAGGNMAFLNALLATADPGDEFIQLTPSYFNHEMAITMANCKPVPVATDDNYQPVVERIVDAITTKTRAVVTISPNNPTGAVYRRACLEEINALCHERGVFHIHDEAYEYFTYNDAEHFSPGSIDATAESTICLYSLSKSFGFASWRIGYMVIPEALFEPVRKIQDTNVICPPVISQFAACGAMHAGRAYCRKQLRALEEVREVVEKKLATIADICDVPPADGAFYYLLRIHTDMDPMSLVERFIREYHVAVMPGSTFGLTDGCAVRIAYGALEKATVVEGIGRLVTGLRAIVGGP